MARGTYISRGRQERNHAMSKEFNIDNGNGTTDDDCILHCNTGIEIKSAKIVYTEQTDSGDASSAHVKVGTTVGGVDVVAQTALGNAAAANSETALTLVDPKINAGESVWVRHTGVASTQVGKYKIAIEYVVDHA